MRSPQSVKKRCFLTCEGRSPEILRNFRAATGTGMHFLPQTKAFAEENAGSDAQPSLPIEQAVLRDLFDGLRGASMRSPDLLR